MPDTPTPRELQVEPLSEDENVLEQLVASTRRIEQGLRDMSNAVAIELDGAARPLRLRVRGPEPRWLGELRMRCRTAGTVGASVVLVPRADLRELLALVDEERQK
jgi:hypothetical protein